MAQGRRGRLRWHLCAQNSLWRSGPKSIHPKRNSGSERDIVRPTNAMVSTPLVLVDVGRGAKKCFCLAVRWWDFNHSTAISKNVQWFPTTTMKTERGTRSRCLRSQVGNSDWAGKRKHGPNTPRSHSWFIFLTYTLRCPGLSPPTHLILLRLHLLRGPKPAEGDRQNHPRFEGAQRTAKSGAKKGNQVSHRNFSRALWLDVK